MTCSRRRKQSKFAKGWSRKKGGRFKLWRDVKGPFRSRKQEADDLPNRSALRVLVKSFSYPLSYNGGFLHTPGARDFLELLSFSRPQFDAHGRPFSAHKHRFAHFFQIMLEVGEFVVIPEARQFFDGISVW